LDFLFVRGLSSLIHIASNLALNIVNSLVYNKLTASALPSAIQTLLAIK